MRRQCRPSPTRTSLFREIGYRRRVGNHAMEWAGMISPDSGLTSGPHSGPYMSLSPMPTDVDAAPIRTGLRVLVVGLGRFGGGVGVTRWLADQGAAVTVTDQVGAASLADSIAALGDLSRIALHLGGHDTSDVLDAELVIINPAVAKAQSELFRTVEARGIPWTTELNLFCERCLASVIGVTGTYGKSTTCAMLTHVLQAAAAGGSVPFTGVHLGGNIGRSLLPDLHRIRPTDIVVLEMSSAQLENLPRIPWTPRLAVITNLHPHHLDRYERFSDYIDAKLNIIGAVDRTRCVVAGQLNAEAEKALLRKVGADDPRLVRIESSPVPFDLRVPGRHNQINASGVLAVCGKLGLSEDFVRAALRDFRGLPHRLEHVGTREGVTYCNDSKSTAPAATVQAVESLGSPIIVLIGGESKKDLALEGFAETLARRCRMMIGFGEAGPAFIDAIRQAGGTGVQDRTLVAGTVEEAFRQAVRFAEPGDTVLLSPGAPSFDAYVNYTERGRHFTDLVHALV